MPKKNYLKTHLPRIKRGKIKGTNLEWGETALISKTKGVLTEKSLIAAFKVIQRILKLQGRHTYKIFQRKKANISITKKPLEMRMGKGVGSKSYSLTRVREGQVIFEVFLKKNKQKGIEALKKAGEKLSVKTSIISNYEIE